LSGKSQGECGTCAVDADCQGHTGNICDTSSGLCVVGCHVDADCDTSNWCTGTADSLGTCLPKLDNGKPLPATPDTVATCSPEVGLRVCKSGVCDPKDNACGLAPGDGSCNDSEQCRNDNCDQTTMTCATAGGCKSDAECPSGDFCASDGTCSPKLPTGTACSGSNQCQSADCTANVCSTIVGLGGGCATRPSSGSNGPGAAGMFALLLAFAGLARRRQRARA
jgi:MYXO-CTERM domain-containing protein